MEQAGKTGARPLRFDLHLPVWYRMAGEADWHNSVTQNISRSGAAIHTEESVLPGTPVAVRISLPSTGPDVGGCLTGLGRVVRTIEASASTYAGFAITVKRYRLDRRTD